MENKQTIKFIEQPSLLSKEELANLIGGSNETKECNCRCGFFIGSYCGVKCKHNYCKSNSIE